MFLQYIRNIFLMLTRSFIYCGLYLVWILAQMHVSDAQSYAHNAHNALIRPQIKNLFFMFIGYRLLTPTSAGSYWEDSSMFNDNCNGRWGGSCRVQPPGTTLRPGKCNAGERILRRNFFDNSGVFDFDNFYSYLGDSQECCNFNDYETPCSLANRQYYCEFDSNNDNMADSVACISCTALYKPDSSSYHAIGSSGPISGSNYGADWNPTMNGVRTASCGHGYE